MLILLPPSEGKAAPAQGEALDLAALSFPELSADRHRVLEALSTASAHPEALSVLGVGPSLGHEVARNLRLLEDASAPAHQIYNGVLYDALGYSTLTPVQRARAAASILVISGLWGAVALNDRIPAYRLSMSTALPGLGRLSSFWKPRLAAPLAQRAADELVIDCRSSAYSAAWHSRPERTVEIKVFQESAGKRTVVSHFAKHTRGEFVRHLLSRRGKAPATAADLLRIAGERWQAELVEGTARHPQALHLVLEAPGA
ncbi:YaaA family protein [Psychromicrobium xiongbiense]|uniref:YaaA family protein n=1 Tax=Psychromicrobium xiongbiense TaxID=3051184 RepID=UPI0025542308|nr:peroxide stress protein YaaA [Psychromicrobium sp. YIM S02556]